MNRAMASLSLLFHRLWAKYGAQAPYLQDPETQRTARDYAQMCYLRGYERGRQDARMGVRRSW